MFDPPIFHPNVFPSGKVSLSLLEKDWVPTITVKEVMFRVFRSCREANFNHPGS